MMLISLGGHLVIVGLVLLGVASGFSLRSFALVNERLALRSQRDRRLEAVQAGAYFAENSRLSSTGDVLANWLALWPKNYDRFSSGVTNGVLLKDEVRFPGTYGGEVVGLCRPARDPSVVVVKNCVNGS